MNMRVRWLPFEPERGVCTVSIDSRIARDCDCHRAHGHIEWGTRFSNVTPTVRHIPFCALIFFDV